MPGQFPVDESEGGPGLARRRVLIALGAAGGACLVAHLSFRASERAAPLPPAGEAARPPRLGADVLFAPAGGLVSLRRQGAPPGEQCRVNRAGAAIARRLDGSRDISAIARELERELGLEPSDDHDAKVAYFVAQLGELDLLAEPFYACLYEVAGT